MPSLVCRRFVAASSSCIVLAASLASQSAAQTAVQVNATVTIAPPAITFTWLPDATATGYLVERRLPGAVPWGSLTTVPGGAGATSWIDTAVVPGQRYEYRFSKNGAPAGRGLITAGIEAAPIEDRGALVLLVEANQAALLGWRVDRLVDDLRGDGYRVLRHDVAASDTVVNVKSMILAEHASFGPELKTVFVLGHVPVPYSGQLAPDGHPDHNGAWPADLFYGELNGLWTDTLVNTSTASRLQNRNVPGDGKYDQSSIPNDVELAVGRVDFFDMPSFAQGETQLLADYLDKDHDYRHQVFAVEQRAVIDDNFGYFGGEAFAASGWRNGSALCGNGTVLAADYFSTLNTPTGTGYAWSYGCGGGSYTSAGGVGTTTDFVTATNRSVFTMLFGSYFGDWDSTDNFLRAALCQGWTLSNVWAGRPHWSFHAMGLGQSLGYCTRVSQNDTSAGGYGTRFVHVALMGDPTLRQHVIAPPSALTLVDAWPQVDLGWTASLDSVAGYHVYRSTTAAGPFARVTPTPVVTTNWTDAAPPLGEVHYMVRALRLETAPTGSYWNLSQGAFATATLPSQAAAHLAYGAGCDQLQLSASPAPVSTATTGTLVTYTIDDIPEASPSSGAYIGLVMLSTTPDLVGTSLAMLGMPTCTLYLGTLDASYAVVGATSTQTTGFVVPAGVPPGVEVFAQAVALTEPGLLNAFGASTSNGVRSFVNNY